MTVVLRKKQVSLLQLAASIVKRNNGSMWGINNNIKGIYKDTNNALSSNNGDPVSKMTGLAGTSVASQLIPEKAASLKKLDTNRWALETTPTSYLDTNFQLNSLTEFTLIVSGYSSKTLSAVIAGCSDNSSNGVYIGVNNNGFIGCGCGNKQFSDIYTDLTWLVPRVVTMIRSDGYVTLRVDGIQKAKVQVSNSGSSLNMFIGGKNNTGTMNSSWGDGVIGPISVVPKVMRNEELLLIETITARWVGAAYTATTTIQSTNAEKILMIDGLPILIDGLPIYFS